MDLHAPLVKKCVGDYLGKCRLEKEELLSAANLGLIKAVDEWDPTRSRLGARISFHVNMSILSEIRSHGRPASKGEILQEFDETDADTAVNFADQVGDADAVRKRLRQLALACQSGKFNGRELKVLQRMVGGTFDLKLIGQEIGSSPQSVKKTVEGMLLRLIECGVAA